MGARQDVRRDYIRAGALGNENLRSKKSDFSRENDWLLANVRTRPANRSSRRLFRAPTSARHRSARRDLTRGQALRKLYRPGVERPQRRQTRS